MPPLRVLTSGAGIAGSTLAWFLAKTGARVTVVEKAPILLPHGQNVDITGSALKVVQKMGLMDEVRRCNTSEKGTQFIDPRGRPFAPLPVREGSETSFTSEFEILRGDLAALLYKASKDLSNVDYKFNTTITRVVSNNVDDTISVELNNGETQEYDLLVAADGQWSKTRKQCFPQDAVTVIDKDMFVVYFTIPRLPPGEDDGDNDWWNIYHALPSKIITLRPDPHGTVRAMFTLMPCSDAQRSAWIAASKSNRKTQQELLRREFQGAGWQAKRLLEAMDRAPDFYFQNIQQVKMTRWSNGRVTCVGDAGYAPSPITGKGTSLAITGAYVLAGEISKLGCGSDHGSNSSSGSNNKENISEALAAYETAFRPFVEETQDVPRVIPGIMHPETALQRWVLHSFLRLLSRVVGWRWLAERLHPANDDDFVLPGYPEVERHCYA
ncbi:MAG: hypothetical protein Q9220_004741 [cf. Caloplaca sp. 1 TL-2023]